MKLNEPGRAIPFEQSAATAIALVWSGQFLIAILALVLGFVLRAIKPAVHSSVLVVTSIRAATAILACVAVAMGMGTASLVVEVFIVSIFTLLLFFTETRIWAYILIVHAAYIVIRRGLDLDTIDVTSTQDRTIIGTIAVEILIIWALADYLRLPKQLPEKAGAGTQPHEEEIDQY